MIWRKLLHSRPPSTVWFLSSDGATVAVRQRSGVWSTATVGFDGDPFTLGAVGLHGVDAEALRTRLGELQQEAQAGGRPVVVLPSTWIRCHILELSGVPRRRAEMEEVVRWRLKKVIAVPPAELRLSVVPLGKADGRHRLLCVVALERAVAALEQVFAGFGIEPGVVTPRLFALPLSGDGWRVLFEAERTSLAAKVLAGEDLRLVRLKTLSSTTGPVSAVRRELRLLAAHLRDVADGSEVAVTVLGSDPVLTAEGWAVVDAEPGLTRHEARPAVETTRAQLGTAERLVLSSLEDVEP